jgi:NADH-quinone oxidoreductase subunit J
MNTALIFFLILAAAAVVTALGLLFSRSAIYAALFLIMNFSAVAFLYLTLDAPFIAMAQVTVYAGAIMILFLFVIMVLGAEKMPLGEKRNWQLPVAIVMGLALAVEGVVLVALRGAGKMNAPATLPADFAAPADIGKLLFNQYMLPFEMTGVILLVAVIGAIVLTHTSEKHVYKRDERRSEEKEVSPQSR